jgi:hypothetical protein
MVEVRLYDDVNESHGTITTNGSQKTVQLNDNRIADGKLFSGTHIWYDNAASATSDILFMTDTSCYVHLWIDATASGIAEVNLYENTTTTNDGTEITSYIHNRNSTSEAVSVMSYNPELSATGTSIALMLISSTTGRVMSDGGSTKIGEFVLATDTKYLVRITDKTADTADCAISLVWGESTGCE